MISSPTKPLNPSDLAQFIDHTLLKADATEQTIEKLCEEAVQHHFYAVCVNGAHVAHAKRSFDRLIKTSPTTPRPKIAAVVGFPLGAMTTSTKVFEAKQAVADGASEIDMVIRIDLARQKNLSALKTDVAAVVESVRHQAIVKVILETALLSLDEIAAASAACDEAGAHFVKTCTGFSTAGACAGAATVEHVALMRESVSARVQVKASGGIRDFATAVKMIEAGATRLGTSSGVQIVSAIAGGPPSNTPSGY